tara:strand:+ start:1870 stop:2502 length:633 start_codon:yes stop_codon:yes gene_type:complete
MVNIIGEFKSVRNNNNHEAPASDQRDHGEAECIQGSAKPEAATGGTESTVADAGAVPPAVTDAEKAEERLGVAMLREALSDPLIPNPSKWKRTTAFAQAKRAQLAKERRERVRLYAEEGIMTVPQAAQLERVVQTTIRQDCQLLGVRLRASEIKVSPYQGEISARRDMLAKMAPTGVTRAAAASELGVSEATVRRDLQVARIVWKGNDSV